MANNKKLLLILLIFTLFVFSVFMGCTPNNQKPMIAEIPNQTAKTEQQYSYQVIAYSPGNGELFYSLSEKPEGMQIDSSGLLTWTPAENQTGFITVEVKVIAGSQFAVKQFEITVTSGSSALLSIEALPSELTIQQSESVTITSITACFDDGSSTQIALNLASYQSSDTSVATVTGSGVIKGVLEGTAIVTITYVEGSAIKKDTINVNVLSSSSQKIISSISVLPSDITMYSSSMKYITSITAYYNDATNTSVALNAVNYQSSNTGVVSVSNGGVVSGKSVGNATITVTYQENGVSCTDTVNVVVIPESIELTSISVIPTTINIEEGDTQTLTSITAYYDDASNAVIVLNQASYQSSDTAVATVNNNGVVAGQKEGSTTITVSFAENGVTKKDTVTVTVFQPSIVLDYIRVLPSTISIYRGHTNTISSITAYYNDDSSSSISLNKASYQSSDINIATVNNNGVITGIAVGTATVTVTYNEDSITKNDTVNVTIKNPG